MIGVGVAGYLALMLLLFYSLQEPYPFLDVSNESGRPLLIEQAESVPSPGAHRLGVLTWRVKEGWPAGSDQCEQTPLVARDLHGTVVARRTGACRSDTWIITAEGLPPAPHYQREPVPSDLVEVRLVLDSYGTQSPVVAWWRALPQILERAARQQAGQLE